MMRGVAASSRWSFIGMGMAHHTGRIDLGLGIHDLGWRDIILIAAMPLGLPMTPFATDPCPS